MEDFFWTGSGDGPPDFLKKVHTGISKGKDVILKTETVVATVYVDGNNVSSCKLMHIYCYNMFLINRKSRYRYVWTADLMMVVAIGIWEHRECPR